MRFMGLPLGGCLRADFEQRGHRPPWPPHGVTSDSEPDITILIQQYKRLIIDRLSGGQRCRYCFYSRAELLIFRFLPLAAKLLTGPKTIGGEMMARTSSTIKQSLVQIEQHTSVWGDKVFSVLCHAYAIRRCRLRIVNYFNKMSSLYTYIF